MDSLLLHKISLVVTSKVRRPTVRYINFVTLILCKLTPVVLSKPIQLKHFLVEKQLTNHPLFDGVATYQQVRRGILAMGISSCWKNTHKIKYDWQITINLLVLISCNLAGGKSRWIVKVVNDWFNSSWLVVKSILL